MGGRWMRRGGQEWEEKEGMGERESRKGRRKRKRRKGGRGEEEEEERGESRRNLKK